MSEPAVSSKKKNKMVVSSATKSVKFLKAKTPSSDKRKFAKTPHSSKTPNLPFEDADEEPRTPLPQKKKRKLSFSDVEDSGSQASSPQTPADSPRKVKKAKNATPLAQKDGPSPKAKSPKRAASGAFPTPQDKKKKRKVDTTAADDAAVPAKKDKKYKKKSELTNAERMKERADKTIFVGNLPTSITKEKIAHEFSVFGKVKTARLRCIPLTPDVKFRRAGAILKKYSGSAISAYIKFASLEAATKALSWNGHVIDGHRIRVDLADPKKRKGVDKNRSIFLRNLDFNLTDDELWQAFSKCGEVESVRIIKDETYRRGKGLGYVNFTNSDAVELALKLNETKIKGREVKVYRYELKSNHEPNKNKNAAIKRLDGKFKGKKPKKGKGTQVANDFAGNKSQSEKKKKVKKITTEDKKKKKIAKVLTGAA